MNRTIAALDRDRAASSSPASAANCMTATESGALRDHQRLFQRNPPIPAMSKCSNCTIPADRVTSSAAANRPAGTVKSSALEVLRFTNVWYLVGACTGSSAVRAATQNAVDIGRCLPEQLHEVGSVGHKAASRDELAPCIHRTEAYCAASATERSRLAVVVASGGKTRPPFGKLAKDLRDAPDVASVLDGTQGQLDPQ